MVEDQALDRVHRIGQTKPVTTTRYIIDNSIEEVGLWTTETKSIAEVSRMLDSCKLRRSILLICHFPNLIRWRLLLPQRDLRYVLNLQLLGMANGDFPVSEVANILSMFRNWERLSHKKEDLSITKSWSWRFCIIVIIRVAENILLVILNPY